MLLQLFIAGYPQDSTISYDANKPPMQLNFGVGSFYNDFKNQNKGLSDAGYSSTGRFAFSISMESVSRNKNFLIVRSLVIGGSSRKNDDYKTLLTSFYKGLNFGYYIANSKKFHLAPEAGIGLYSSFIKISSRNAYDNGNSVTVTQQAPALDFRLRFDFADFTKTQPMLIGFRLGYSPGLKVGWNIQKSGTLTLDSSPKDRINQFYVLVTVSQILNNPIK